MGAKIKERLMIGANGAIFVPRQRFSARFTEERKLTGKDSFFFRGKGRFVCFESDWIVGRNEVSFRRRVGSFNAG